MNFVLPRLAMVLAAGIALGEMPGLAADIVRPPRANSTSTTQSGVARARGATQSTSSETAILRLPAEGGIPVRGVDLESARWYASADLPADAPIDIIRSRGTSTTPTVTLRSAVAGGSGILFCLIEIPGAVPAGAEARVTIADIDGNDETFFNGRTVGHTTGWGVTDFGQSRLYQVPHDLLKPGINVLAIRLTGFGDSQTFGLRHGPITFALTPPQPTTYSADSRTTPPGVMPDKAARKLIAAADKSSSEALLQRKRDSFGRFGEFFHNGLPAVSEVTPTRIATRNGPSFDVSVSGVQKVEVARSTDDPGIDGWHMKSRVTAVVQDKPVVYTMLQQVTYPGAIIEIEKGTVLPLRVRFPEGIGQVISMTSQEKQKLFGKASDSTAVFVFYPLSKKSSPALLVASGVSVNITQASTQIDVSVARDTKSAGGKALVYIFYPTGLYLHDLASRMDSISDLATKVAPDVDPADTIGLWARIGLYETVAEDEYFDVMEDKGQVRIYQLARYRPCPGLQLPGPLAVRPPQVDFAAQSLNYPVGNQVTSSTGVLAFSGDLHYSDALRLPAGSENLLPLDVVLTYYDLPIPPMSERAAVVAPGKHELKDVMQRFVMSELGTSASVTAVDALYKGRVQAYQAWSYLSDAARRELSENGVQTVPLGIGGHFWNETTETLSGLPFWWTYFIQGPAFQKYDQDWGNGLSLYGLEVYAQYSGNWGLIKSQWDAVDRIFQWFTVSDDWEWMRAGNAPHGYGTGAGDCMNATFAGCIAYARLAQGIGRIQDYHYGIYMAARAALPALNRFAYNEFATANEFKSDPSMVLGFHEGRGFLEGELNGYPWNATSNISGNGIETQCFDLFMAYAQDALRNYEQIFEKSYPHWMDGTYKYPEKTLYHNNSGYITLPHIYLRARLGGDSFASLTEYVDQAVKNPALWWIAPPVLAEVLTRKAEGVVVTDWGHCVFLGGELEPDPKDPGKHKLVVRFNNQQAPDSVEIALPRKPNQFKINGGPVPLTDSRFENGRLRLQLRRPGLNTVIVVFSQ